MKSKDLIAQLQELDPSGETEVVVGGSDIYFASEEPMWYDGTPILLIRNEAKKPYYHIDGFRMTRRGNKIQLHTMNAEDVLCDHPETTIELDESTQHYLPKMEALRQRMREEIAECAAEMKAKKDQQ